MILLYLAAPFLQPQVALFGICIIITARVIIISGQGVVAVEDMVKPSKCDYKMLVL